MRDTTGWSMRRAFNSIQPAPTITSTLMKSPVREESHADRSMRIVAQGLARAFLAADVGAAELRERGTRALGRKWPWLGGLVRSLQSDFGDGLQAQNHDEIVQAILAFVPFRAAFESADRPPEVKGHFPFHEAMRSPPRGLEYISLPMLDTPGDLARWLGVSLTELDWFSDIAGWGGGSPSEPLRHYRYQWLDKTTGGVRLLEIPKPRLRDIQRRILREILDLVPAHAAAHGSVARRSTVTNALVHAGKSMVVRLDLADFFSSISGARVFALFETLGYPPKTARYLTGLATHCAPRALVRSVPHDESASPEARRGRKAWALRFTTRHLPQGAPTSAALANLCAYRLDLRLAGAAKASQAIYTRYVDDLFFSSQVAAPDRARRFAQMAYTIILEEGFAPNARKTQIMSHARAQYVTGLVVNEHPNVPRRDYDRLKAVLTNCIRRGIASENHEAHPDFRSHLAGRVSYVQQANPARGAKLRALLDAIQWN
jgi:RNA-directed DNA polymerase